MGDFAPEPEPEPEPPPMIPMMQPAMPQEEPEEEEPEIEAMAQVAKRIAQMREQREPFIPAGASEPTLAVPIDVEITDTDIEQAIALFDRLMPELAGMLDTQEVIGQNVYDGEQY